MTDEERKLLWQKIQSSDQNLAKVLEDVKRVFGKPESVEVNFKEK